MGPGAGGPAGRAPGSGAASAVLPASRRGPSKGRGADASSPRCLTAASSRGRLFPTGSTFKMRPRQPTSTLSPLPSSLSSRYAPPPARPAPVSARAVLQTERVTKQDDENRQVPGARGPGPLGRCPPVWELVRSRMPSCGASMLLGGPAVWQPLSFKLPTHPLAPGTGTWLFPALEESQATEPPPGSSLWCSAPFCVWKACPGKRDL